MQQVCEICLHERTMGRCWRLTCPVNGGTVRTLELARKGEFYRGPKEGKLL